MERIINFISKSPPFCLGSRPLSMIWAWGHKQMLSKLSVWIISKVESSCIKYIFFRASVFFRRHVWRGILDLIFFRGCCGISAKVWESELKNAKTERNFNILVLGKKKIMERFQSAETQLPSSQQLSAGKLKKMFASETHHRRHHPAPRRAIIQPPQLIDWSLFRLVIYLESALQ